MPGRVERRPQATDDQPAHHIGVTEANFGLGGMDVHVDLIARHLKEQRDDGVPVARQHFGIGATHRTDQQPVLHRTAVDEQILVIGNAPVESRQPCDAAKAYPLARGIYRDTILDQRAVGERGDARDLIACRDRQRPSPIMVEREGYVGPCHRQPLHDIDAGGIFAARTAEKFGTGGHTGEQSLDFDARSRRQRSRTIGNNIAIIDSARPPFPASDSTLDGQPRNARNRGQRLATKAHRADILDELIGQFRRGVAFERQSDVARVHPAPVVDDLNPVDPATRQNHRNPRGSGIYGVLDKLFQRCRRTFDNLASGDAIDQMWWQAAY